MRKLIATVFNCSLDGDRRTVGRSRPADANPVSR